MKSPAQKKYFQTKMGFQFIQLKLKHESKGIEYPLGWTLSTQTQKSMEQKLNEIGIEQDRAVGITLENIRAIDSLRMLEGIQE